jgi:hypothetical protein
MGLDMYLKAETYVGDWEHDPADGPERQAYKKIVEALGIPGFRCPGSPHLTVSVCVAYWRKANQIHNWFVKNVQGGEDECQRSCVSREQLQELLDTCKEVLANRNTAREKLSPQAGFFFGSTEIDNWYWEDIKSTIEQLTAVLGNPKLHSFEYQASW